MEWAVARWSDFSPTFDYIAGWILSLTFGAQSNVQ
jgi:hypothetical protein